MKNVFSAVANTFYDHGFKGLLRYEINQYHDKRIKTIDAAYNEAFRNLRVIMEHQIPKMLSLFESIIMYVAKEKCDDASSFSLSGVRRYYETGVKSPMGEALIEYGFPIDAIVRLEKTHAELLHFNINEAKKYFEIHQMEIIDHFDDYEKSLFVKAIRVI